MIDYFSFNRANDSHAGLGSLSGGRRKENLVLSSYSLTGTRLD